MSNILKIVDLMDHAIRCAVLAVLDGLAASDRLSTRGLARVPAWRFGLPPWEARTAKAWRADDHLRDMRARSRTRRHARSTVMFVGGYPIRRIQTRFGDIYAVIGTNSAFATLAQAEAHVCKLSGGRSDR